MVFWADGKRYVISWEHFHNKELFPAIFIDGRIQASTQCTIRERKKGVHITNAPVIARGRAECSHLDQYDKDVGRKISLGRALQCFYPIPGGAGKVIRDSQRVKREYVWNIYNRTVGKYYRKKRGGMINVGRT